MSVSTLEELLVEELRDLYDAEKQLVKALPRMAKAASSEELREAFTLHTQETKGQVERLEQVFELLGERARSKPCKGMKGLVEEGNEKIQEDMEEALSDEALISAAQKVEHYEIAAYGTARELAKVLGHKEAVSLLNETIHEEGNTDKKLTAIARTIMKENIRALRTGQSDEEYEPEMVSAGRRSAQARGRGNGASRSRNGRGRSSNGSSRGQSKGGHSQGRARNY